MELFRATWSSNELDQGCIASLKLADRIQKNSGIATLVFHDLLNCYNWKDNRCSITRLYILKKEERLNFIGLIKRKRSVVKIFITRKNESFRTQSQISFEEIQFFEKNFISPENISNKFRWFDFLWKKKKNKKKIKISFLFFKNRKNDKKNFLFLLKN